MQLLLKIGFTIGLLTVVASAVWGIIRIWSGSFNVEGIPAYLRGRAEEQVPTLLRDPETLYQAGAPVGRVQGVTIDQKTNTIHFDQITGTVDFMNPGAAPMVFRTYRIRATKIDTRTGVPPTPYVYTDVTCAIEGPA